MGLHECSLCQFSGATGVKNLFVPSCDDILVAPELITHYINAHHYVPPLRFIEAIRAVADCRGMEYKKSILRNNGAFLLSKSFSTGCSGCRQAGRPNTGEENR